MKPSLTKPLGSFLRRCAKANAGGRRWAVSTSTAACYTVPIAIQNYISSEEQRSSPMPTDLFVVDIEIIWERNNVRRTPSERRCLTKSSSKKSERWPTTQREIEEWLPIAKQEIEDLKAAATNVERFVDISNKYADLRELTPEVLRTFIEWIIIHERTAKHSKSATQQIDIYFRYIGQLAPEAVA